MKYFVSYIYKNDRWFRKKTKLGNAIVEVEPPMNPEKIRAAETALEDEIYGGGKIILQNFIPLEDIDEN